MNFWCIVMSKSKLLLSWKPHRFLVAQSVLPMRQAWFAASGSGKTKCPLPIGWIFSWIKLIQLLELRLRACRTCILRIWSQNQGRKFTSKRIHRELMSNCSETDGISQLINCIHPVTNRITRLIDSTTWLIHGTTRLINGPPAID